MDGRTGGRPAGQRNGCVDGGCMDGQMGRMQAQVVTPGTPSARTSGPRRASPRLPPSRTARNNGCTAWWGGRMDQHVVGNHTWSPRHASFTRRTKLRLSPPHLYVTFVTSIRYIYSSQASCKEMIALTMPHLTTERTDAVLVAGQTEHLSRCG